MNQYMEEARHEAERCWADWETCNIEFDKLLCESFAKRLAVWMETAAMMSRNADLYRGLLDQCAEHLGREAYTADDGTVMEDPVLLKIPELVEKLVRKEKGEQ